MNFKLVKTIEIPKETVPGQQGFARPMFLFQKQWNATSLISLSNQTLSSQGEKECVSSK